MNKVNRKVIAFLFAIMLVIGSVPGIFAPERNISHAATGFAGGEGTISNPYQIESADQLNEVRTLLSDNKYFKLIADIDMSGAYSLGSGWEPIGSDTDKFYGNIDGNGYHIKNLMINRPLNENIGLFGFIGIGSKIVNMKLVDVNITGDRFVGSLAGRSEGSVSYSYATGELNGSSTVGGLLGVNIGSLSNSYATTNVNSDGTAGGLVGSNSSQISYSYATGMVSGGTYVGGLAGSESVSGSIIEYSYATGKVNGNTDDTDAGGLVGFVSNSVTISNSYAIGDVYGGTSAGGLVGHMTLGGTISNSYAAGAVDGAADNGGLVGKIDTGTAIDSFYDIDNAYPSSVLGTGRGNSDMKDLNTFTGWNFSSVWGIDASHNDGYPYLLANHVTYNGNNNDTGDVPTDNIPYSLNSTVSVMENAGNLTRAGYTFAGWNTSADGSGTDYAATDKFEITADTILYAHWISKNAQLNDLTVDEGTLSLTFSPSILNYTVDVANPVTSLGISIEKADPNQTLSVTGDVYTTVTHDVYNNTYNISNMTVGPNNIQIQVIAEDGTTNTIYTVAVNRASRIETSDNSSSESSSGTVISTDGHLTLPAGWAGEVSLGRAVSISIPTGATNKELELTIEKVLETQNLLAGKEILSSPVFEFVKSLSENFLKPITITFAFDPALLKTDQTVWIFYFDEENKTWVEVAEAKINGNYVAVQVNHFTKFAVLVVDEATGLPITGIEPPVEVHFSDISGHWAESFIKQAANGEIINGYPDSTFRPNQAVTRAEFIVMLMKVLDSQEAGAALTFTDTMEIGNWAQQAVSQALQAGIIQGYEDHTFRPNGKITRAQMAVMIAQSLNLPNGVTGATSFADDKDIPIWAKSAVESIKQIGLVKGQEANIFAPQANTTRAEAVTVLINLLSQINK